MGRYLVNLYKELFMAKSTVGSIFDNKDILNEAIEQFKSLFIEVQQIIISKQFKDIPQYLSKLEHFNQQYAEIYQRKSEISSSITHFHNFNEAIINLYLPQLPEQLASLNPIDNFFALFKQAQDIIENKKFDLAEQYLNQVRIFREQHGELIKFIFRTHDPLALNTFNDFTDFIQQYPSLLECSASNDNLIVNDISAHLKEKIIMIEAKGLRKSKKLSVIKTLDQSEHIDNPQGKIDHVELLSEKSANEQTIVNSVELAYKERGASATACTRVTNDDVRKFKSIDYIEPQCTTNDKIGESKSNDYIAGHKHNDIDTTNNINQINSNVEDNSHKTIEQQTLDTNKQNDIQVVVEPTIGNKIHVIMSPIPHELDMENCVDWFIEAENPNSPTTIINEAYVDKAPEGENTTGAERDTSDNIPHFKVVDYSLSIEHNTSELDVTATSNNTLPDTNDCTIIATNVDLLAENINENTNSG